MISIERVKLTQVLFVKVQFGHAGSSAHGESETADAKNKALAGAGVNVPGNFDELDNLIK